MFGFLALGFFAAFAFGFIGGDKDGKKDGGFLSSLIKSFKELNDDSEEDTSKEEKELHDLLKKNPKDLSPKEKRRLKELQSKLKVEDILSDNELEKLNKITGNTEDEEDDKDNGKEDTNEENTELDFNKSLAILQSEIESKEDDSSPEANDLREAYDAMIKCTFDGNGDKRKPEDIESEFNKLGETLRKKIEKHVKKSSSDEKALEEYKDKKSKVTTEQAAAALEKAKAKRAEIAKKEEVDALKDAREKELEGKTDDDKKKINERYAKKIEAAETKWDAEIKKHMDAAAKADKSESLRQMEKSAKQAEAKKKELEEQKSELDKPEAVTDEIKKCEDINWEETDVVAGNLSGDDKEKKKTAEEFLKSKDVDVDMYKKYESIKSTLKEGEKIEENEDLKKSAEEVIKKKKEEIDKQIEEQDKIINDYNSAKGEVEKANEPKEEPKDDPKKGEEPKKEEEPKEDPKKGEEPKEDPKKGEDDSFEDEEGYKYKKDGDKYTMTDEKGQEIEIEKEDFEKAKEKVVDDEKEGDERTDNDDDLEDDDVDDKGNSTGKKDPRKVYKRRSYKRGNKTFKTKSYYDKKGNSISAKDFKEKVANFEKKNKTKDESFSITDYLRDKLIVERFYPNDITQFLKDNL